ncbi:hypothetical protein [uncultured Mediterranean phage]|mgnify:FL=1|nr:hypothetical protein [uncultured Mediterranean phage]|tara:strand:+ start:1443 stop:1832 length:390 start_codon:yes stop_codon:yes gene_type:complete
MSHFSTIKTKLKDRSNLLEALNLLSYDVKEDQNLVITNPDHAENHPVVHAEIAVSNDIGFRWNQETQTYDLYSDHATWNLDVPPSRFIDKVTQQYARMTIHNTIKDMGFQVDEEWEMDDNSIELTVTRW